MLDAIGEVLPAAAGVALSPFPIIAIVLVLSTPRGNANGVAFVAGWLVGLTALAALLYGIAAAVDDPGSETSAAVAWIKVAVGVALLALAAKKWRTRPRDGEQPHTPQWMASIDRIEPLRAIGLGAALGGANPKNIAFTLSATTSISELGLSGRGGAFSTGAYVLLASLTVVIPVLAHLALGRRISPSLDSLKQFMLTNNAVIMMVILIVLGAKVLGDGLGGL